MIFRLISLPFLRQPLFLRVFPLFSIPLHCFLSNVSLLCFPFHLFFDVFFGRLLIVAFCTPFPRLLSVVYFFPLSFSFFEAISFYSLLSSLIFIPLSPVIQSLFVSVWFSLLYRLFLSFSLYSSASIRFFYSSPPFCRFLVVIAFLPPSFPRFWTSCIQSVGLYWFLSTRHCYFISVYITANL